MSAVALPSASTLRGSWPIFWLVCPILVMMLLLGLVVLATLFRAPRSEATKVLTIFASAFVRLADRLPAVDRSGLRRLDARRQTSDNPESDIRKAELP